jgi:hypothetical protein
MCHVVPLIVYFQGSYTIAFEVHTQSNLYKFPEPLRLHGNRLYFRLWSGMEGFFRFLGVGVHPGA